jgi:Dolichyl-phosphate-mannose-protein mannosyltransferase
VTAPSGLASSRPFAALHLRVGTRIWLVCIVAGSAVIRSVAAAAHSAPFYFPDEYIYASISRSLVATGRPLIRGAPAHFPALLEPLLAAPLWGLFPTVTAYHLIQVENAVFMSLAAIPAYLLARRLTFEPGYSLLCAAFTVALPGLAFSGFITADAPAYPLVLTSLYAAVCALQTPSRSRQLAFLSLAGLTTFCRLQYVVLIPAFLLATILIEGRGFLRVYRLTFALVAGGAAIVIGLGPARVVGYYTTGTSALHFSTALLKWAGLNLFMLALASGVALVPGAVVGLFSARDRAARGFVALVVPFAVMVMVEAALYAASGSDRFKERYLIALVPLVPLAFGLYLRRERPARRPVLVLSACIAVPALLLPLSTYAAGQGFDDSPLLWSVRELVSQLDSPLAASLLFAACAVIGSAVAATSSPTARRWLPFATAIALVAAISVAATMWDTTDARLTRQNLDAADASWIDDAGVGPVTALETPGARPGLLTEQLFWNQSVGRELVFGNTLPTDAFAAGVASVSPGGTLLADGRPIRTAVLFQGYETTPTFASAVQVASFESFTLWRTRGSLQLRALEAGRFGDGWLAPRGALMVWAAGSRDGGKVSFTLSLPATQQSTVRIRFDKNTYTVAPGKSVAVSLPVPTTKPWKVVFATSRGASSLPDHRRVSVLSTVPRFTPGLSY